VDGRDRTGAGGGGRHAGRHRGRLKEIFRRIVFDGQTGTRNLDLAKLVSVSPRADGTEVAVEQCQKSSGFT